MVSCHLPITLIYIALHTSFKPNAYPTFRANTNTHTNNIPGRSLIYVWPAFVFVIFLQLYVVIFMGYLTFYDMRRS